MYRGLILDLDNTLIDQRAAMRGWLAAQIADRDVVEALVALDDWGYSPRMTLCAAVAAHVGHDATIVWSRLRAEIGDWVSPEPARVAMVERLSRRHTLALLSNGSGPNQRRKLERGGFARSFAPERVLISGEWGQAKPARAIFEEALRRLELDAADVLMIGDDPRNDILGAQAAGLATCWISGGRAWTTSGGAPDWTLEHIEALEARLR